MEERNKAGQKKLPADKQAAIYKYCNYQERCHSEVRNKLYEIGCTTPEAEQLLAELVEQDLLNEERFARAFARGKFRIKGWGRNRITQELKAKKVSDYCIKKGLTELPAEEYNAAMLRIAEKRWESLSTERSPIQKKAKMFRFLVQRGYESAMVQRMIERFMKGMIE